MLKDLFVAWPVCLAMALAMLLPGPELQRLPPAETPWPQQVAAVRAGKSHRIAVGGTPIGDAEVQDLRGLNGLLELELGRSELTAFGAQELAALPNLRRVVLRGRPVDDALFAALCRIPTVRYLNLPDTTITDAGLAALRERPQLVQLRLASDQVTDAGMPHIARVRKLQFLHLIRVPISDEGLLALQSLPQLESLYIDDAHITDAGIERLLKQLPGLHFHINQTHHDRDPLRGTHRH